MNNLEEKRELLPVLKRAVMQAAALVVISCVIAVGANHLRAHGIALIDSWSVEDRFVDNSGNSLTIGLAQASLLFSENRALFLDARSEKEYKNGHVRGALSLPWEDVEQQFIEVAENLENQKAIITYCDGENCLLSHDLALFLKDMGFKNVYVLVNGWSIWKNAGLPVEKGGADLG
jgi:rhodanese-related sulfurtransferase